MSRELGEVERKLNDAQTRNVTLEKEISDIVNEISRIEVLAARERKTLDTEKEKRIALERELKELQGSTSASEKQEASWKSALTANLEASRKRTDELTKELQAANNARVAAECELKALRNRQNGLEERTDILKAQVEEAAEKLDTSESLREELASQIEKLTEEREALQRHLRQTESAHGIERYRLEQQMKQQMKLIEHLQTKPPQTPSKIASENKPPKSVHKSYSKRHEAVPFPVRFPDHEFNVDNNRPSTPPQHYTSSHSAATLLMALGPNRSNMDK